MKVLIKIKEICVNMGEGKYCMICGKDLNGKGEIYYRYMLFNFLCRKCFSGMKRVGKHKKQQ